MRKNTRAIVPLSVAVLGLAGVSCAPRPVLAPEPRETIVAIDVALEADRTPPDPSASVKPHVTVLRGFISGSNLHHFTSSVAMVMATTDLERVNIQRLHERIVDAFAPFAVDHDSAQPFIVSPDGKPFSKDTRLSVAHYVPDASGVNFRPQIAGATGQQPATAATFTPAGISVYQVDSAGTTQRALWRWTGEIGAR